MFSLMKSENRITGNNMSLKEKKNSLESFKIFSFNIAFKYSNASIRASLRNLYIFNNNNNNSIVHTAGPL